MDPARHARPVRDAAFWCVPTLPTGVGRIWIYRTAPKSIGIPPTIVVNGIERDTLLHGTAYILSVPPGRHRVKLAFDDDQIEVDVAAGENVFVRFDVDPSLFGRGFYATRVDPDTAKVEVHDHTGTDFSCTKP